MAIYVFWVYQKYWELQAVPLEYFGYIWAGFALAVSLSARLTPALESRLGTRRLLCLIAILPLAGLLGMALGSGWLGVMFGLLAIFTPLLGLVLVPLLIRIRRERDSAAAGSVPAA